LEPVATGEHEVKKYEVELFGSDAKERVFAGLRQDDLIVLVLEPLLQRIRYFQFIFND
jgi:hypothetical protein